ncbi:MAG: hypothetical protein ACXWJW_11965 [Xanthobacteraceae bacterium]
MTAACIREFVRLAEVERTQPGNREISDQDLCDVLTAAVRVYAARAEAGDTFPAPLQAEMVTATEVAIVVSEMVRVADLNMFDLSMWHGRTRARGG